MKDKVRNVGKFPRKKSFIVAYLVFALFKTQLLNNLLDKVEHDIMNYQNQGLCYLPKPKAQADNTDTRF